MNDRLSQVLARALAWTYKDRTYEFSGFKFESREKAIEALLGRFDLPWTIETPRVERSREVRGIEALLVTVTRNGVSHTIDAFTEVDGIGRYCFEVMCAERLADPMMPFAF